MQINLLQAPKTLDFRGIRRWIEYMETREDIPSGWRLTDLHGAEIVQGRFREHHIPRHSHDGLMLSLIDSGVQRVGYRGADHLGAEGSVIAIPPNEVHTGDPAETTGWTYRTITIPTALIADMIGSPREAGWSDGFHCATLIRDPALHRALDRMFREFGYSATLSLENAMAHVLRLFFERHAEPGARPVPHEGISLSEERAVARALDYLAARMDTNVRLADIAQAAGIDGFRLTRAFTQQIGLPPHAWHLQYRAYRARDMLAAGETVAQAAYAAGFADQAHLTRTFKRFTGLTPSRYRKTHLEIRGQFPT